MLVPLSILYTCDGKAKNPKKTNIEELFIVEPKKEKCFMEKRSALNSLFLFIERIIKKIYFLTPQVVRNKAILKSLRWIIDRLNNENGLGGILPAMIYSYEALLLIGYQPTHKYCVDAKKSINKLIVNENNYSYVQPCLSPVWDTALSSMACLQIESDTGDQHAMKGLDWLVTLQILNIKGDWSINDLSINSGGWAFQFCNDYYPDVDDTGMIIWAMIESGDKKYQFSIDRGCEWISSMQSKCGGFAAFDKDNNNFYLNELPFADHAALVDPPTADVSSRCLICLSTSDKYMAAFNKCLNFLKKSQEKNGSWYGRWGTNYIYGTWCVLTALEASGVCMQQNWIHRANRWLESKQQENGGWGESNITYNNPEEAGNHKYSTVTHTSWAVLALISSKGSRQNIKRGVKFILSQQNKDGSWNDNDHNAPGFPKVFYLKYHGYAKYFPLWALAKYRSTFK